VNQLEFVFSLLVFVFTVVLDITRYMLVEHLIV